MTKNYGSIRIIALPMVLMLLVFGAFGLFGVFHLGDVLDDWHRVKITNYAERLSKTLETEAPILQEDYQDFAVSHGHLLDSRVTIILDNGVVVADSGLTAEDVLKMDNHKDRPEIVDARNNGRGTSTRFSNTLKMDMMYVAVPFEIADEAGVVRVSNSLGKVIEVVDGRWKEFFIFAALGAVIAGILGFFASQNLSKQIGREQLKLEDRVIERTKDVRRLQNLGTLLSACNNTDETTEIIENLVPDLLPDVGGALAIFKSSRNAVDIIACWGGTWKGDVSYSPDSCWALRTGHMHPHSEDQSAVVCPHLKTVEIEQTRCLPMSAHGEIMGALHLVKEKGEVTSEELQIASVLAEQISLAVANIKLRQSLRDQAIRDSLTGLYNRRFLMEMLQKEILRAKREKLQIAVLMIDIDHFKRFNDNFGHDAGDRVLTQVGSAMRDGIRGHDVACRYGGEEFTVVLPGASQEEAIEIADRLCDAVRNLKLVSDNNTLGTISISIGIAMYPAFGKDPEDLIKQADDALYAAKAAGRDRVEVAGALEVLAD